MTAADLYAAAFNVPRTPRSPEYRAGALAALRYRCRETPTVTNPYPDGTAAADAFYSGAQEGHDIWARRKAVTA